MAGAPEMGAESLSDFLPSRVRHRAALEGLRCELKVVMPKKRMNDRKAGKRIGTETFYLVPDPAATVVELAAAERKRA
jgi:hypothetical protein